MKLSQINSPLDPICNRAPKPKIAAEFYVNKLRFFIVSDYTDSERLAKSNLISNNSDRERVVSQFQDRGRTYAIVEDRGFAEEEKLDLAEVLTARELQIVALVARGKSNKQIARQLHISKWTVSTHLRRIFIKLKVDNRAAMVYCCFGMSASQPCNKNLSH